MPAGVPTAAVTEARDMSDEHLAGAELVAVRASRRWVGDPFPGRGLHQLAQHVSAVLRLVADYAAPLYQPFMEPGLPPLPV